MVASFVSPGDRRDAPRTLAFGAALGVGRHEALGLLDCLYGWAAEHVPDGDLAPYADAAIAAACDWRGDAADLVTALLEAGVLTLDATIADWDELFGRDARRREGVARRVARHRARADAAAGNGVSNGAGNAPGNGVRNGARNGVSNGAGNADAPSPPDPLSPGAPPTGAAPTPPTGASGPSGDPGDCTPGEISGPAPGARAREARPVPKPTPTQVRLARIVDLVREAGVEIFPSARDGTALKSCGAPADRIAEAYVAAARGEWDPGGDGWLGDSLSVHLVISRLAGYRPRRQVDYRETRYGPLPAHERLEAEAAF